MKIRNVLVSLVALASVGACDSSNNIYFNGAPHGSTPAGTNDGLGEIEDCIDLAEDYVESCDQIYKNDEERRGTTYALSSLCGDKLEREDLRQKVEEKGFLSVFGGFIDCYQKVCANELLDDKYRKIMLLECRDDFSKI